MSKTYRRRAPRRDFEGLLGVLHKGKFLFCPALQVGEGGALFDGNHDSSTIEVGDEIVTTFMFPQQGGVVLRAKCLYRTKEGYIGVSFSSIILQFKKKIRNFVAQRS